MARQIFIDGAVREMTDKEDTALTAQQAVIHTEVLALIRQKPRAVAAVDVLIKKGLISEAEIATARVSK